MGQCCQSGCAFFHTVGSKTKSWAGVEAQSPTATDAGTTQSPAEEGNDTEPGSNPNPEQPVQSTEGMEFPNVQNIGISASTAEILINVQASPGDIHQQGSSGMDNVDPKALLAMIATTTAVCYFVTHQKHGHNGTCTSSPMNMWWPKARGSR